MTIKYSQSEYVTKSDLKEELKVFKGEFKTELLGELKIFILDCFENFAEVLEPRFQRIENRLDNIETTLPTLATKTDIRMILDKVPSLEQFDQLSLRVNALEEKQ
ncbi:MAG TPA: hypothetical protein VL576_01180 [Candidatus Paceibacterota bacterium]|jgi:hypothetical protein|nr:hypothetical protein [Candidatus Paceibacterota bacterium]